MTRRLHHLTGRLGPGAGYIHPALVLALTQRDHVAVHVALRAVGLDFPPPDADLLSYCRLRAAVQFRLLADAADPATFEPGALYDLADLLDPSSAARSAPPVRDVEGVA